MTLAALVAAVSVALGPQAPSGPSLVFADPLHGWFGSSAGLVATSDGGRTWWWRSRLEFTALAAVDASHGWAVGGQGLFLRTADGRHWQKVGVLRLNAISFVDDRRGFGLDRDGNLLETLDGGSAWRLARGAPKGQALCFADAAHGWLAQGGTIYATADGGSSWRAQRLRRTHPGFTVPALGCRDRDVWVVFHEGAGAGTEGYEVYRSLDRGRSWREVLATPWEPRYPHISNYSGPFAVLGGGSAVLAGSCAACAAHGTVTVVSTRDGGRTFARQTFGGFAPQALSFPDSQHGWLLLDGRVRRIR